MKTHPKLVLLFLNIEFIMNKHPNQTGSYKGIVSG